jgi:hypothetical protein
MAILEDYFVRPANHLTQRWTCHDNIIIGGRINDADDWFHLRDALAIASVINMDNDSDDSGKGIPMLCQVPFIDNGSHISEDLIRNAVSFAQLHFNRGRIYVHCALGNSRSPSIAYAILRFVYRYSVEDALSAIRLGKGSLLSNAIGGEYGTREQQQNYLVSVEKALQLV